MAAVLSKPDIHRLLRQEPPLIEGYINLEDQLQPNGFDLTLREIALLQSSGKIAVENSQRLEYHRLSHPQVEPAPLWRYRKYRRLGCRLLMAFSISHGSLQSSGVSLTEKRQNFATRFFTADPGNRRLPWHLPGRKHGLIASLAPTLYPEIEKGATRQSAIASSV